MGVSVNTALAVAEYTSSPPSGLEGFANYKSVIQNSNCSICQIRLEATYKIITNEYIQNPVRLLALPTVY